MITIVSAFLQNADSLTRNRPTPCAGLSRVTLSEPLSLQLIFLTITNVGVGKWICLLLFNRRVLKIDGLCFPLQGAVVLCCFSVGVAYNYI